MNLTKLLVTEFLYVQEKYKYFWIIQLLPICISRYSSNSIILFGS